MVLRFMAVTVMFALPSWKPQFLAKEAPHKHVYASACAIEVALIIISFAFSVPDPSYLLIAEAVLISLLWLTAFLNEQQTSVRLATIASVVTIVSAALEMYPAVIIFVNDDQHEHRLFFLTSAIACGIRVLMAFHVLGVERSLFTAAAHTRLRASLLNFPDESDYQVVGDDDAMSVSSQPDPASAKDIQKLKNLFLLPKYWLDSTTFSYSGPLFRIAKKRPLMQDDMPLLRPQDRAKPNSESLYKAWESRQSLVWALKDVYGTRYLATGMLLGIATALNFCGPLALQELVKAAENGASVHKVNEHFFPAGI